MNLGTLWKFLTYSEKFPKWNLGTLWIFFDPPPVGNFSQVFPVSSFEGFPKNEHVFRGCLFIYDVNHLWWRWGVSDFLTFADRGGVVGFHKNLTFCWHIADICWQGGGRKRRNQMWKWFLYSRQLGGGGSFKFWQRLTALWYAHDWCITLKLEKKAKQAGPGAWLNWNLG